MEPGTTERALADITDEGKFERLATAVLRIADPLCFGLSHPGVTALGKTQKGPLDGVGFVRGEDPPHLVAAHHTTTTAAGLRAKWLHDPSTVKPRGAGGKPTAPPGDVLKTAEVIREERSRTPNLSATLFLTTNAEPDEALNRDVKAAASARGFDVDVWTRSRIAHVLDFDPDGQWVRAMYLGIPAERLSRNLLAKLSKESLEAFAPPDDPRGWVARSLDRTLANIRRPVTFLVAGSGLGKSVACYRALQQHVNAGGFGLVLDHEVISAAVSLDQALSEALRKLHPTLASGERPLALCDPERPLLVVVEDINRSGQPERLLEKLVAWVASGERKEGSRTSWRIFCPVWPQVIARLGEPVRKAVQPHILVPPPPGPEEGTEAALARAALNGRVLSRAAASRVSAELGHDPLLIALQDNPDVSEAHDVIAGYVDRSLARLQAGLGTDSAAAFDSLRALSGEMLARRRLDPTWREVTGWSFPAEIMRNLQVVAQRQEILGFEGAAANPTLRFRHDRVRDWLLIDAASALITASRLSPVILKDPFFAEVMGACLARIEPFQPLLAGLIAANPLAVFHALRLCRRTDSRRPLIAAALSSWLKDPTNREMGRTQLLWAAELVVSETEGVEIPALARDFPRQWFPAWVARLRNGDLGGAIHLFANDALGTTWLQRDELVAEVKLRFGQQLIAKMDELLRTKEMPATNVVGLLRFAGFLGEPDLSNGVLAAWNDDAGRLERLSDYLWALARCCSEDNAEALLDPVCDLWAGLSDVEEQKGMGSPRNSLAADGVRMAFGKCVPSGALAYFVARAAKPDLAWPITYMLHEVDHPLVVTFFAEAMAQREDVSGDNGWSFHPANNYWWSRNEAGHSMSPASRLALQELWTDLANRASLRRAAFSLWAAVDESDDVAILRQAADDRELARSVVRARAYRGDTGVIPEVADRLRSHQHPEMWWRVAHEVWDPSFLPLLGEYLDQLEGESLKSNLDWTLSQTLERLTPAEAEALLVNRWEKLGHRPRFFQQAFALATPRLLDLAAEVVASTSDPKPLFHLLNATFGIHVQGRPGIQREGQVLALAPYLDQLQPVEIRALALACNNGGWFETRRRLLDPRLDDWSVAWKPAHAKLICERALKFNHPSAITYDIDLAMSTGVSWPELLEQFEAWYCDRGDLAALEVFASAVQHKGARGDLSKLQVLDSIEDKKAAADIIENTVFVVQRRSAS